MVEMNGARFLTYASDGGMVNQGQIMGCVAPGWYAVRYFDWLMGDPGPVKLVAIEEMARWWDFYQTAEDVEAAVAAYNARRRLEDN